MLTNDLAVSSIDCPGEVKLESKTSPPNAVNVWVPVPSSAIATAVPAKALILDDATLKVHALILITK